MGRKSKLTQEVLEVILEEKKKKAIKKPKKNNVFILPSEPDTEEEKLMLKYRIEDRLTIEEIGIKIGKNRQYVSEELKKLLR